MHDLVGGEMHTFNPFIYYNYENSMWIGLEISKGLTHFIGYSTIVWLLFHSVSMYAFWMVMACEHTLWILSYRLHVAQYHHQLLFPPISDVHTSAVYEKKHHCPTDTELLHHVLFELQNEEQ